MELKARGKKTGPEGVRGGWEGFLEEGVLCQAGQLSRSELGLVYKGMTAAQVQGQCAARSGVQGFSTERLCS